MGTHRAEGGHTGPGAAVDLPAAGEERIVIPLSGAFTVTVDGDKYPLVGRAGVFSRPTGTGKQ